MKKAISSEMIKKVVIIVKYNIFGYLIGEGFGNVLKNKKSTPEKKYKKLYKKLSKSKMERITHAPIIKQTLVVGDKFLSFPIGLLSIPHVIYFDPIAGTYAVTYKDWLDNITVRELMEKENKKNK